MFHALHKIWLMIVWSAVALLGLLAYREREFFWPAVGVAQALAIREGFEQQVSGEVSGKVVKVYDGETFQIRDGNARACMIRLTGVDAPDYRTTNKAALRLAGQSHTNLSRLILSNIVRVEITYTNNPPGALGVVYLGRTNINAAMVASGAAVLKREYMNGLPFKEKYALLQAERNATLRARE
jgi:endonuclease YncB( thermonuclease family)